MFKGLLQPFSAGARRRQTKRTKTKPFAACFRSEGHETQRNPAGVFGWLPGAPRARLSWDLPWAGVPWVLSCRTTFYRVFHSNARGWAVGGGVTEERGGGVRAVRRIAVLGNAGGGKSTLSLQLSERLRVPYHSVDKALWRPGWRPVSGPDFARVHGAWISEPGWVIDGWGDMAFIQERLERADAVVLVEHPLWRHCYWALKRQCGGVFFERSDGPAGCRLLPRTWQLVKAMRWIHRFGLPELKKQIRTRCRPEAVYHVGSPAQLAAVARALAPP